MISTFAINGRGFFQVLLPDGSTAYSRNGQFHLNLDGEIVTANGQVLQPSVTIPPGTTSITISRDGVISVVEGGTGDSIATQVGQIQLADFINPAGLESIGSNLYFETTASGYADDGISESGRPGHSGTGNTGKLQRRGGRGTGQYDCRPACL